MFYPINQDFVRILFHCQGTFSLISMLSDTAAAVEVNAVVEIS